MKKVLIILGTLIGLIALVLIFGRTYISELIQGPVQEQGETDLSFKEIPAEFTPKLNLDESLPFMGLAAIDVDGDGIDEVFVANGRNEQDAILKYNGSKFTPLAQANSINKDLGDATFGAASIDATKDGLADLFIARESGVYFYKNTGNGFTGSQIEFPLDRKSLPLSIALGDINKDGAVDLYISNYIRSEFVEGETIFNKQYGAFSNLLLNNGDNTFTDITKQSGVYHQHNTFLAVFVDLNNNSHSDLVVAHDTGTVGIYRNNGDNTFTEMPNPSTYSYPMGIAVSDYNNDGLMDLYFSNVGTTLPTKLVKGDLREDQVLNKNYMLFENKGDFIFEDVALDRNAALYGFGWGVVSFDFNNDSLHDYLITQNYARFPGVKFFELYPGNLLQQYSDGGFKPVETAANIENKKFGMTPVVSDFNQDGSPDVVFANLNDSVRVFINQGTDNHWLKVRLKDEPASIGAIVRVTTDQNQTYTNQFYTSEGLSSDQSHELFFGLGKTNSIKRVTVNYQDGRSASVDNPKTDSTLSFDTNGNILSADQ